MIFLSGGVSQLETWDPKPGTDTGGPFQAIPTSVPGMHICELLPAHRQADAPPGPRPRHQHARTTITATARRSCTPAAAGAGHRATRTSARSRPSCSAERQPAARLHPHHAAAAAAASTGGTPPSSARSTPRSASATASRPPTSSGPTDADRRCRRAAARTCRQKLNDRFAQIAARAETEAYTESYDQAERVVNARRACSTSRRRPARPPTATAATTSAGTCLLARRLLEAGVTFVKVTHSNYDTHHENFDFHIEQLGEFDQPFATLLDDLAERGMLEQHAGRRDVGVRPHAEDQPHLRPRPLGERPGRSRWPAAGSRAGRSSARPTPTAPPSPTAKSTAATCSTPTCRRWAWIQPKNFYPERAARPDRRPEGRGDQGNPGVVFDCAVPKQRESADFSVIDTDAPLSPASPRPRPHRRAPGARTQACAAAHWLPIRPVGSFPLRVGRGRNDPALRFAHRREGRVDWPSSWVRGMAFIGGKAAVSGLDSWKHERADLQGAGRLRRDHLPDAEARALHARLRRLPRQVDLVGGPSGFAQAAPHGRGPPRLDSGRRRQPRRPDGRQLRQRPRGQAVEAPWTAKPIRTLDGHASHVYNVAFHPDGKRLVSCDLKGVVKDWNLNTGTSERELDAKTLWKYDPGFMADIGGARAMTFSADGTQLACAGITNVSNAFAGVGNPAVVLFDWKDGKSQAA